MYHGLSLRRVSVRPPERTRSTKTQDNSKRTCLRRSSRPIVDGEEHGYSSRSTFLCQNVPIAAEVVRAVGSEVHFYRKRKVKNCIGEWIGPYTALSVDENRKLVYVKDTDTGFPNPFGYAQVSNFIRPHSTVSVFLKNLGFCTISILLERHCRRRKPIDCSDQQRRPSTSSPMVVKVKRQEVQGLFDRDTFEIFSRKEMPRPKCSFWSLCVSCKELRWHL